jgi:solute:Na+ symporter, SSS family
MTPLRTADVAVLLAYLVGVVGLGCVFSVRSRNTDAYMAAGRSLPGWAVGLSMFGSYISSISFLGNPGKAFGGNWNGFVFSLATPVAAVVAVLWLVPFYRRQGNLSAYEHLEHRFGPWARTYAVVCFLLLQVTRTAAVTYFMASAVSPLLRWDVGQTILVSGTVVTAYTALGGMRGFVWAGVLNSVLLIAGPVICLVALHVKAPGGLAGVIRDGGAQGKFSLGSFGPALGASTFWVMLAYGLVMNLGNFAVDQSYVQRFITARSDREAAKGVWITALLYPPTAAAFFFIGTALAVFYAARPGLLPPGLDPAQKPDDVFPAFITTELPLGLAGLVIAAVFAASMDSNLNSMATLTLCDLYQRYFRPHAGERESMWVLHVSTVFWGLAGTVAALAMIRSKNVLDVWWQWSGVFSGGVLGLLLLGFLSRRARNPAAMAAVAAGVGVIVWMTLSRTKHWPGAWAAFRSPFHELLANVVGTVVILLCGLVLGVVLKGTSGPLSRYSGRGLG